MSIGDLMSTTTTAAPPLEPPEQLAGAALAEWHRLIVQLPKLPASDRGTLAQYCTLYARWQEAEARIAKEGTLIKTKSGNVIQHPCIGISNTAAKLCRSFAIELGITPRSRAEKATESKRPKFAWERNENREPNHPLS